MTVNLARRSARSLKGGLAILVITMLVITLAMLFAQEVPDKNREMVSMVVGAMLGYGASIVNHYFPNITRPKADP